MNRKLIVLLAAIAVTATTITVAACAAKKSAKVKTAAAAPAIQAAAETTAEVINDGQNPVMNFIGDYHGGRATVNVDVEGKDGAKITVTWGNSYDSRTVWTMSGIFCEDTASVSYENGIKKVVTYNENGGIISEEVLSTNCKGTFVFSYDGVTWDEQNEHIADGMVFRFGDNVEEEKTAVVFPAETVTIKHDEPAAKPAQAAAEPTAKPTEAPKPTEKLAEPTATPAPEVKPAEPAAEPVEEVKEPAHKTAAEISGTYRSGRATVTVDAADPDNVMIKVVWGDSADTTVIWRMSGRYDEERENILYAGCVKKVLTYNADGEVIMEEVCYTEGNGEILFSYDGFTWADYDENIADNMVFIKEA